MDITERKRAEEELRASEERFRTMFELSPYSTVFSDLEGTILACNEQFTQLHATTERPEAQVGKKVSRFFAPEERARLSANIRDTVDQNRAPIPVEYTMLHEDGTSFPAEATTKVVLDEKGRPTAILAMAHDITGRKNAERERLDYQRKLRSLAAELSLAEERERRRIATGLHDQACQTLVLSKMKLQGLRKSLPLSDTDEMAHICSALNDTIQSIRELTFDLSSPTLYKFGLEAALEELLEDKLKAEHGIHCMFHNDGVAKPLSGDVRILLYQSVRELLINTIKHARAHTVTLDIAQFDGSIRITVTDDGIGFDVEEVLSASSRPRGFGLFNIRERLDYIGGSLDIDSQPGARTQFTLVAPLAASTTAA